MSPNSLVAFTAAFFSGALALVVLCLKRRSVANGCFVAGMAIFAIASILDALSMEAALPEDVKSWQVLVLLTESFLPGIWLCFSLSYSRGNSREFLARWRLIIAGAFLFPVGLAFWFRGDLIALLPPAEIHEMWWLSYRGPAKAVNALILVGAVLVLMNLERTFRSAVGTMRWRIKFFVLGLAAIFGTTVYVRSQALLFSGHSLALTNLESGALLVGCVFMMIGYLRTGLAEIDVYPSRAVLENSVTVLLAGGYLFIIGVLAQLVAAFGGARTIQLQSFLVLLAVALLGVLAFSDRLRQGIQRFVSRHFKRPQHDSRRVWTLMTQRLASAVDEPTLCGAAVSLVSETFNALSVTIWLVNDRSDGFVVGATTGPRDVPAHTGVPATQCQLIIGGLRERVEPFDLDQCRDGWTEALRALNPIQFQQGGRRVCIPLCTVDRCLGAAILADRVRGVPYSVEEMELVKCIGDQIAAALLNMRLTGELMQAKQLEAFQAMSSFFVHDLKNTASSLNLMLENLPVHFDNPEFRQDALRSIAGTTARINQIVNRLSLLRNRIELKEETSDINELVAEALDSQAGDLRLELIRDLHPVPMVIGDREQLRSVIVNLLVNARESVNGDGRIRVETSEHDGRVVLTVEDNGCGMSAEFLRGSLFRPFHTTKKNGIGIGMFHAKRIVEAHRGSILVESEPGKGTRFKVILPGVAKQAEVGS